ncbi:hypothetical protein GWI33_014214 [Rhynchophorus ferrugineus]|uniref:Uncharacterized protein n=1 Tax=Rhynchophorus ferrugineus TaxID=354439 RepID=A0A834MAV1_RHYFE|nr:hypothetical protein GWI33_014214 [Rhynchophorus ferrugineus]
MRQISTHYETEKGKNVSLAAAKISRRIFRGAVPKMGKLQQRHDERMRNGEQHSAGLFSLWDRSKSHVTQTGPEIASRLRLFKLFGRLNYLVNNVWDIFVVSALTSDVLHFPSRFRFVML